MHPRRGRIAFHPTTPSNQNTLGMKREKDLLREILERIESAEGDAAHFDFYSSEDAKDMKRIEHHAGLLKDAGYIKDHNRSQLIKRDTQRPFIRLTVSGLTLQGSDFLDQLREQQGSA